MKKYAAPAVKMMAAHIHEGILAASGNLQVGSEDLGLKPSTPDGGDPSDAI